MLCWVVYTYRCSKISQWLHFQLLLDPENRAFLSNQTDGNSIRRFESSNLPFTLYSFLSCNYTFYILFFFSSFVTFSISVFHICWTKRHGHLAVSNSASYQQGSRVNYWPGGRLPWNCCFFSVYWKQMAIYYLRLDNKHFSTNPCHQIIYNHFRGFVPYRIMNVTDEGTALLLTLLNLQDQYRQLPWPVPLHVIQNSELQWLRLTL